ncbi:2-methylisocitrate lyase [Pectobacterium actinidiae]|uniref:2-methylisocitrate lyase n=1 Tax=Pectobacterium actinidiae TaxID=1507808 RepID=A0A1V2R646_9GAMM|nr:isocitrate lyase/phosphoenolpyruvate mutase family protein [Pectobacterium actinidiae]QDX96977.1 isocitrate lyase/phosphoenolpyruvate mutase family protein [Pectobacterium carotovorum subsp. carotovorum]KHN92658.1 putative carboxyvinyl-carboxyphosphonate phosphorylmutase [Pectobacterium actinidiae]ONK05555.1 2-methylisocitrate lyase [Pectobacterium actinidiae]ONK07894.1 2-methylisocitrate lyase [Pectobacterium actinidiae]GLW38287.1 2-methylisocitrate lyase [Pectobacterium carotovorum subsp.
MSDKSRAFRLLHESGNTFVIPNPWDIGTARILEKMGFMALATTSAGLAFSLGVTEGQVPWQQTIHHCRNIAEATTLPVSADLEKGMGDSPDSAAETIRIAVDAGLAGCSLEDHTGQPEAPIFDLHLAVERISAAVESRDACDPNFVITARAENFMWGHQDLDETILRLQAFEKAGADVLYAPGIHDLSMIHTLCQSVKKPVNVVMGLPGNVYSVEELSQAGAKRISVGASMARFAYGAFVQAAQEVSRDGTFSYSKHAMGFSELEAFFRIST